MGDPTLRVTNIGSENYSMPHLHHLSLTTKIECVTYLMTHTVFPASCTITIQAGVDVDELPLGATGELQEVLDLAFYERLRTAFPDDHGFRNMTIEDQSAGCTDGATITWDDPVSPKACPASFTLGLSPSTEQLDHLHPAIASVICHILSRWPDSRPAEQ